MVTKLSAACSRPDSNSSKTASLVLELLNLIGQQFSLSLQHFLYDLRIEGFLSRLVELGILRKLCLRPIEAAQLGLQAV